MRKKYYFYVVISIVFLGLATFMGAGCYDGYAAREETTDDEVDGD